MTPNDDDRPRTNLEYYDAAHAMQTGVAHELERDPKTGTPKDLRVGINSAMVTDGALAQLLIAKGIFTEAEYAEAVRLEMCREVDRLEARLSAYYGRPITLR